MDRNWIKKEPKAELHIHMEGSLRMETLNRIARRRDMEPLQESPYRFKGFEDFTDIFVYLAQFLTDDKDFYDMALDFTDRQAMDNIVYTEAFIMPSFHIARGVSMEGMLAGIDAGLSEGEKRHKIKINLIYSIPRLFGSGPGEQTLDLIKRYPNDRVIGIDLAGTEKENDVAPFAGVFERARAMGLNTVAHAGELAPSSHVRQTLDLLGVQRIGHGISAWQDDALIQRLADEGIPLEISPSSNIKLKTVPSMKEHPVKKFHEMGVPIVINTDDPAFFDTTLSNELSILAATLCLEHTEIEILIENAFIFSFT